MRAVIRFPKETGTEAGLCVGDRCSYPAQVKQRQEEEKRRQAGIGTPLIRKRG
nr:hypothetical protein [Klebsiella pneumoniae]